MISVAIALAGLTWRIAGHAGTGAITVPSGARAPAPAPDIAPALALAPFGKRRRQRRGRGRPRLPLELKGGVRARPAELSVAYISVSGAPATPFRVGEAVGGATIDAILRDRVILSNGGRSEFLAFPDPLAFARAAARRARPPGRRRRPRRLGRAAAAARTAPPRRPGRRPRAAAARRARRSRGGYRIGANAPAGYAAPATSSSRSTARSSAIPIAARGAFAAAQASGSAQIQILRDGKRLTLTVPMR